MQEGKIQLLYLDFDYDAGQISEKLDIPIERVLEVIAELEK